jgi:2'-5' RNA ligase
MRMYQAKLYVMIKATPESLGHLRACRSWHALDEHYPSKTFHSTLLKLGLASAWPPEKLGLLIEALGAVRFDPFEVLFDEIDGTLLRGGAGSSEAKAFHQALRRAALPCGVELPLHNFWLHHSLAYKGEGRPRARIDPIGWRVEEFLLVRSDHGHELLGRWPLVGRQYALAL